METWFVSVLLATLLAGISNFAIKVASKHNYDAGLFSLYGGLLLVGLVPATVLWGGPFVGWLMVAVMLFIGTGWCGQ